MARSFKNLFLVNHDDLLVGEAELFLCEFDEQLARSSHWIISGTVKRIEEYLWTDDVICAVETQLLGQVRCSDFQLAVCRLDLVVDFWDFDVITSNMRVGSQEFDDVQRKFRVFENARTGRTAPYLSEIRNWLKLFYFIFSPGFSLFLRRLNQLVSILCQP